LANRSHSPSRARIRCRRRSRRRSWSGGACIRGGGRAGCCRMPDTTLRQVRAVATPISCLMRSRAALPGRRARRLRPAGSPLPLRSRAAGLGWARIRGSAGSDQAAELVPVRAPPAGALPAPGWDGMREQRGSATRATGPIITPHEVVHTLEQRKTYAPDPCPQCGKVDHVIVEWREVEIAELTERVFAVERTRCSCQGR
jgi:hypothetical protein